jgi:hypothetical protein
MAQHELTTHCKLFRWCYERLPEAHQRPTLARPRLLTEPSATLAQSCFAGAAMLRPDGRSALLCAHHPHQSSRFTSAAP